MTQEGLFDTVCPTLHVQMVACGQEVTGTETTVPWSVSEGILPEPNLIPGQALSCTSIGTGFMEEPGTWKLKNESSLN